MSSSYPRRWARAGPRPRRTKRSRSHRARQCARCTTSSAVRSAGSPLFDWGLAVDVLRALTAGATVPVGRPGWTQVAADHDVPAGVERAAELPRGRRFLIRLVLLALELHGSACQCVLSACRVIQHRVAERL